MARTNLNLQPNEGIVLENEGVVRILRRGHDNGTLTLTTKNLYFSKGRGKKADITIFPLNQIKVINGQVQVRLGSSKLKPVLQVCMINSQEEFEFSEFSFAANAKKEIEKWVFSIQQVVCDLLSHQAVVPPQTIILQQPTGSQQPTADTTQNSVNNASNPIQEEPVVTKISCKCIGCMAPIIGNKGDTVRCKYCDTEQIL